MRNPFSSDPEEKTPGGDAPDRKPAREVEEADVESDEPEQEHGDAVSETRAEEPRRSEPSGGASETKEDAPAKGTGKAEGEPVAAPSLGPNTVIERKPPEERLDFDKISDQDAMGRDKRREVVGGTYGPTRVRVFATFAAFFAVVAAVVVGFYFLAKELDQPPAQQADDAPWAQAEASQTPPKPLQ